jgi:single-stranded DNA-binding protein
MTWHRVVVYHEALTKIAERFLKKGSKVYLKGQIEIRKWTDQFGETDRQVFEISFQGFGGRLVVLDGFKDKPAMAEAQVDDDDFAAPTPSGTKPSMIDPTLPWLG